MDQPNFDRQEIRSRAARWMPNLTEDQSLRIVTDTTEFFDVGFNDIVVLDGRPFLVRNNAKEGRFGLDDEVKHWVKRAISLDDEQMKIIKLVFHEKFMSRIGDIEFECFRSPKKEARILKLVEKRPNFMHGYAVEDSKRNLVRVVDYIRGRTLTAVVEDQNLDHQRYFHEKMPEILKGYLACVEGIRFLHEHGEKHGDIRRDHILIDRENGNYRWIDFDYNYRHRENIYGYDLFGLGNVLVYIVGQGDVRLHDLKQQEHPALPRLYQEDLNIVFHNRVANLAKIFPYVPDRLNQVLLHFSAGARRYYETTDELLEDLNEAIADL